MKTVTSHRSTGRSYQSAVISVLALIMLSGCNLRYAATEAQKENAWIHAKVCAATSQAAQDEDASERLCRLTALSARQSEAFVLDYGIPHPLPGSAGTPPYKGGELAQRSEDRGQNTDGNTDAAIEQWTKTAQQAQADAAKRPDVWVLADGAMELGLALAGLLGGVYGLRAAAFIRQARQKAQALKEIVQGNELFKQLYPEHADRFKEAQAKQSPATRQIVTELK